MKITAEELIEIFEEPLFPEVFPNGCCNGHFAPSSLEVLIHHALDNLPMPDIYTNQVKDRLALRISKLIEERSGL